MPETVVTIEGPRFSTRAESKMIRAWGADIINMSVATEAALANEAGMPYAAVAMSTDYDCWKTDEAHVTVDMVVQTLHRNIAAAKTVITDVIPHIPAEPSWPCHDALRNAIMTDRSLWPLKTRRELQPLLAKYL